MEQSTMEQCLQKMQMANSEDYDQREAVHCLPQPTVSGRKLRIIMVARIFAYNEYCEL